MQIAQALYYKLSNSSDITNIVSTRIFPGVAPQSATTPYIIYQLVSNDHEHTMGQDPGIYKPRYQISAFSSGYNIMQDIRAAVSNTIKDNSSDWGGTSQLNIQRAFLEFELEFSHIDRDTMFITHHLIQDYVIWHTTDAR